ncbi:helix-turn-helix domain-containing protein [Domibacillus indicus]|uniref:helix-turn-helix domain-containing protein n=1 Tax=Domibacillus indicus TaxID=1437523 RepID=UPI000617C946|nr:helix-turn-helix transcriptional regulator [Domibacillus indicus]
MGIRAEIKKTIPLKDDKRVPGQVLSKKEKKFIENLVYERKKSGFTQRDIAKKIGSDQAAIARLETMRVNPTLKTIISILDAMDMQIIIVDKK